ncbi:MAG: hypothetical protein QXX95_00385 [Nitrososphaerales archaeon]
MIRNPKFIDIVKFTLYFLIMSLIATVLHEYFHLITLKVLGGKGTIDFSLQPIVFPWDASTTRVEIAPKGLANLLLFHLSGSLATTIILIVMLVYEKDFIKSLALKFVLAPQLMWSVTEPLYAFGLLPLLIDVNITYHMLLFSSWSILSAFLLVRYKFR